MCETKFGALVLRTILIMVAVQYVLCEKTSPVDVKGEEGTEESVDMLLESLGRELSNETFSEIWNFWDEEEKSDARSLQETPNNYTSLHVKSKSTKKDAKFGNVGGGGHGGAGGGLGGGGGGLGGGGGGGHGGSSGGQKKRKGQKKQQSLVKRIMPIMFIPFMISTAIIPVMIFVIKLLFMKAAIVAKVAVTLVLISFFKRRTNGGGVYNYNAWKMR